MANNKWDIEILRDVALRYNTKKSLRENEPNVYNAIKRKRLLHVLCSHMAPFGTTWTFDMLQDEALKYTTRSEFHKRNGAAYKAANYYGFMNTICSHMKSDYTRPNCVYLWKYKDDIYKIGISSMKRYYNRLERVCKHLNMSFPEDFVVCKVTNPWKCEVALLKLGEGVENIGIFDGSTEFRKLSHTDYRLALDIIEQYREI